MPQAKRSTEEVAREYAEVAFDRAYEIREEYTTLLAARKANRDELRNLKAQGFLNEEQERELEEIYPARDRSEKEAEEEAEKKQPANA